MSINLLYGCCQIETCTRDLAAVREFMICVLDGTPIEQDLARQISELIPDDDYDVDHIECGEAVFQVNRPSPSMTYNGQSSVHQAYLDRVGPCVTNLNYYIDDHAHARQLLTSLGAEVHIEGPSSAARALADYGPDNTRPGAEERPFLFMGTRQLIGLDLELMEPNFLHFSKQSVQFPAFVHPRPSGSGNLLFDRLVIVVPDLREAHANLLRMFAPASRSKAYAIRESDFGESFCVGLGGMELEYVAPQSSGGEAGKFLERFGPGVMAIAFGAQNPSNVIKACEANNVRVTDDRNNQPRVKRSHPRWLVESRTLLGFDIVLEEKGQPFTAAAHFI